MTPKPIQRTRDESKPARSAPAQTIFRNASPASGFTTISNQLLQCKGLAPEVRGFIAAMLSRPRDWRFSAEWALEEFGIGEKKLKRIIRDAKAAGFMKMERCKQSRGRFAGPAIFMFTDTPNVFEESDIGDVDRKCPKGTYGSSTLTVSAISHRVENPPGGKPPPIQRTDSLQRTENLQIAHPPADDASETCEAVKETRQPSGYVPTDFESYWSAYPKKRGRKDAERLWRKLSRQDRRAAIEGIRAHVESASSERFIRQGDTYLRKATWRDFPKAAEPSKPQSEWERRIERYATVNQQWPLKGQWGPPPGKPGCLVPAPLVEWLSKHHPHLIHGQRS